MQALISALNPAIAILCAVNLLWHLRALAPMRALNAKLRHSGDIVAVCTTGAYNYSMASNYNRIPRPPVVMLTPAGSYIAVRRETLDDLTALDL